MDQGEKSEKDLNPRAKASLLQIIFFYFAAPILKKGRARDLQEKDIYKVLPKFRSEKLGNQLEAIWNTQVNRRNLKKQKALNEKLQSVDRSEETASILWCLIKKFGWFYFGLGLIQLVVKSTVIVIQPRLLSRVVAFFQPDSVITQSEVYGYAFSLIAINIVVCIYNHNYQQLLTEYSIEIRTSLCSLIYRKALKLSPIASEDFSTGKLITLITKDVYCIDGAIRFFNDVWIGVIQVIIVTVFIYNRVGAAVFVGIGFIVLMVPIQSYCGHKASQTRLVAAKKAEDRIQLMKETLNAIKIIKMYTWEKYFEKIINFTRTKETDNLKIIYYLKATILVLGALTMKIAFFLLIFTYTMLGQSLTAETVYFIQQCFFVLRSCITVSIPLGISSLAELSAALRRFKNFLSAPELKPLTYNVNTLMTSPRIFLNKISVKINDQKILKSVSLNHEKGLLIVSGNIGSGKSSLLKTILNEYPYSSGEMIVQGSISYAPEEPWLFPSTIRQNILFGQLYDEERYEEVLRVCGLKHDLNQFKKSDNTVVGDKGINLSKGQQARICLARAVYKKSDIYLLDDCLSALDGHINKHVFKECITGFLKDKLVLLVNNNINNIKKVPTGSVLFIANGKTMDLEQQKAALDKRITYYMDEDTTTSYYQDEDDEEDATSESDALLSRNEPTEPRKNLYHEESKKGAVLWKNYVTYYKYTGGVAVLIFIVLLFFISQFSLGYSEKLLSQWVNTQARFINLTVTNQTNSTEYDILYNNKNKLFHFYALTMIGATILSLFRSFANFYFCTRAGRKLHKALVVGVLNAYMTFFDSHFIGNIVNRVSKDFHTIDENIPFIVYEILRSIFSVLSVIVLLASVSLYSLIPAAFLFSFLYYIRKYYMPTGRSLKRLDAATRSPMVGYVNASLDGLTIVRAYRQERILQHEFDLHQDLFTSAYYMSESALRLFAFSLDMVCVVFMGCIVLLLVIYPAERMPGDVGLAINQAMSLIGMLQFTVRQSAEIENTMTSVERVLEYADTEPEKKFGETLSSWPRNGTIIYDGVNLTYKTMGEQVLKHVSFTIEGKSKIGIVGRTGAGKTSIISALFRLYDYEGLITIDNVNIKTLPLERVRSSIGIIPQDPILFKGSIRSNIDPLNRYSDTEIWSAIEKVQMKRSIISLDQSITDSGKNYSAGQRQLICLARALVCKNKIVVLDEATANMDVETDKMLQKTIQDHFADCTVITIAHRINSLQTADKILVVEDGRVVQFDHPTVLLGDKDGLFYKMVQDSGVLNF